MLSSLADIHLAAAILARGGEAISNGHPTRDVAGDERLTVMPRAPPTESLLLSLDTSAPRAGKQGREKYLEWGRVAHFHLCTLINQPTSDGTRWLGLACPWLERDTVGVGIQATWTSAEAPPVPGRLSVSVRFCSQRPTRRFPPCLTAASLTLGLCRCPPSAAATSPPCPWGRWCVSDREGGRHGAV